MKKERSLFGIDINALATVWIVDQFKDEDSNGVQYHRRLASRLTTHG